ncbi:MAG: hypothetical protein GXX90_10550 [Microbacteriaceae bacterium]|nr:hypothetical protein [Microbacteriaceae bacterium]
MSEGIERLPLDRRAEAYGRRLEQLTRALDDPDEPLDFDFDFDSDPGAETPGEADADGADGRDADAAAATDAATGAEER